MNYYNEFDKKTAAWLRELINQGYLPKGDVDERSIVEVHGSDLTGYTQCHFFAGIGGWSYALQLAGWPADEPVWTGSCPCQPFSCAGKGKGTADERHLWPEFARLIAECKPPVVFGEQVASAAGRKWLGGHEDLPRVRDAKTILGVLQELQGWIPQDLHRMLESSGARTQGDQATRREVCIVSRISQDAQGKATGERGEASSQTQGDGLQSRCGRCGAPSLSDNCGCVSSNGDSIESRWRQDLGQSINRPDGQFQRIREGQREDCSVLPECDGERVGRKQDSRNSERHHGRSAQLQRAITVAFNGLAETASRYGSLSGVFTDLEGMGYAAAGADLCAAGVGAPHVRQRLFWVADDEHDGSYRARWAAAFAGGDREDGGVFVGGGYAVCGISDTRHDGERGRAKSGSASLSASFDDSSMGKSNSEGLEGAHENNENAERVYVVPSKPSRGLVCSASGGCSQGDAEVAPEQYDKAMPWGNCIAIKFRDGKTRRIAPIVTPVAYGIPARVVRVRGYGNAIVPQVAAEFIRAFIDASECINASI